MKYLLPLPVLATVTTNVFVVPIVATLLNESVFDTVSGPTFALPWTSKLNAGSFVKIPTLFVTELTTNALPYELTVLL